MATRKRKTSSPVGNKIVKKKAAQPFAFVLEELAEVDPVTRPMFGCLAVYVGDKIVLILREKGDKTSTDDGVWLATTAEHHSSLRQELPSMRSIEIFGGDLDGRPTGWQILPADSDDFEAEALKACRMVLKGDVRIGKIPASKKAKRKPK